MTTFVSEARDRAASRLRKTAGWIWLLLGALSLLFVGWRYNLPFAAWMAPIFLLRFFRGQRRWLEALAAIPLLEAASYIQLAGAWDLDPWQFCLLPLLRPSLLILALFADRALVRRLPKAAATLVFPSVYLALDYGFSFTPFGTVLSLSVTQFSLPPVALRAPTGFTWPPRCCSSPTARV